MEARTRTADTEDPDLAEHRHSGSLRIALQGCRHGSRGHRPRVRALSKRRKVVVAVLKPVPVTDAAIPKKRAGDERGPALSVEEREKATYIIRRGRRHDGLGRKREGTSSRRRQLAAPSVERRGSACARPPDADRPRRTPSSGAPLHEARARRPQPADHGPGQRSLHAAGRLQAHALAEPRPFRGGSGAGHAPHPRRPRASPQPQAGPLHAAISLQTTAP